VVTNVAADVFALVEAIVHVRHAHVVHVHTGSLLHALAFHVRTELVRIVHDVRVSYVLSVYASATLDHGQLLSSVEVLVRVGRKSTTERLLLVCIVEATRRQIRKFLLHLFEFVIVLLLVV
jgi:hypothetical protein